MFMFMSLLLLYSLLYFISSSNNFLSVAIINSVLIIFLPQRSCQLTCIVCLNIYTTESVISQFHHLYVHYSNVRCFSLSYVATSLFLSLISSIPSINRQSKNQRIKTKQINNYNHTTTHHHTNYHTMIL